jgi:hypothetical protein
MSSYEKIANFSIIIYVLVILAGIGGYIANIVKVVDMFSAPLNVEMIVRIIGLIVWPIGSIMGFY